MKQWTVTYREKSGVKTSVVIEAEDRAGVFAELKQRGINAISITEGAVKAKRSVTSGGVSKAVWGVVAAVVVVALIGVVWMMSDTGDVKKSSSVKNHDVNDVAQNKAQGVQSKNAESKSQLQTVKPSNKGKKIPYWELPTPDGLSDVQKRIWKIYKNPPSYTNTVEGAVPPSRFAIFPTYAENAIASIITLEPGQNLVGTPIYGSNFEEEFLRSCDAPIVFSEEDDEYRRQLKMDMNVVRQELKERIAKGEKLSDILYESRREIQRMSMIKQEIETQVQNYIRNDAKSEADVNDIIELGNKMLEEKGIAPIRINPLTKRVLIRSVERKSKKNK